METLTRFFVQLAYFFDTSLRYKKAKEFCRSFLEYSHSKLKFYFDIFMVLLVVVSVFLLLYEVKNPDGHPYLEFIVQFSLVVFIIEYLLRFWIASDSHALFLERYEYALNNNLPLLFVESTGVSDKKEDRIYHFTLSHYRSSSHSSKLSPSTIFTYLFAI